MKIIRRLIPVCVILLVIGGFAYWIYSFYRPMELDIPEYDKVEIVWRDDEHDGETSYADEIEKITELMRSISFAKSFRSYTETPPMPYRAEVAFKNEGETVLSMWIVEEEYPWASTRIILHPLVEGKRLVARDCDELTSLLLSYVA